MKLFSLIAFTSFSLFLLVSLWNGRETAAEVVATALTGERIVVVNYKPGSVERDDFGFKAPLASGDGLLATREPTQACRIEQHRGRDLILRESRTLAQIPMSEVELEQDMASWQKSPLLKFTRKSPSFETKPAKWPDWFPMPTEEAYIGTITTSDQYSVQLYRGSRTDTVYVCWHLD